MTFSRYNGIDYSGAETPSSSLKGLRVYAAEGAAEAVELLPPPSPRKYWTRRGLAEWLAGPLQDGLTAIVGIELKRSVVGRQEFESPALARVCGPMWDPLGPT